MAASIADSVGSFCLHKAQANLTIGQEFAVHSAIWVDSTRGAGRIAILCRAE